MNKLRSLRLFGATMVASFFGVASIPAQPFGQWDFNSSNLTATVGVAMQYADGGGGATDVATAFGSTPAFGIPAINGSNATVMRFPAATGSMGYFMPSPAANGGGSLVNEYTVIFDLLYPTNGIVRPLVDTDGSTFVPGADFIVGSAGGIGVSPSGPFDGALVENTWHRVGFTVTATAIHKYIDGVEVGSQGHTFEGRLALTASAVTTLILANTVGVATPGYVNSIQLRDVALNAGQMEALGGPSAAGIPQAIPAVPSFVQSRTPGLNATGISPKPSVSVVLHQGDTTITGGSIQLSLDGVNLATTVTPTSPTFTATASVTNILDPNSQHTLRVVWTDSVAGSKTNTWSFTVQTYQVVNLPAPFYLETFDGVDEATFPANWFATNNTETHVAGFDLSNPRSDAYKDWVVITTNTLNTAKGADPLAVPPILVNGAFLTSIANDKLCYAESDSRNGSQVQMLFATNINCSARSNVFLSFHSIYAQNQDNIASVEYSTNGGATWLPVLYMIDAVDGGGDIFYTNGVIDVGATFGTPKADYAYGKAFSNFIGAPVTAALIPFISGRTNDDLVESIRVELIRLPAADLQPNVSLRFMQAGTGSWWFGIDEVGLYVIDTPVITSQPANQTVSATGVASFGVVATSPTPLSYQWQHAGTNLSDGGHFSGVNTATLTISNADTNDAGSYRVIVSNSGGSVNSSLATLTVVDAPQVTSQPVSVIVSAGFPASFSGAAVGRPPLRYQWLHDGIPVSGATSASLSLLSAQPADAGQYRLVVTNVTGAVTSSVARLTVVSGSITNDLVVHLKFDNDYNDSSGRANNAAPVGSPGFNASGKIGQAFQYTTIGSLAQFDYATLNYPPDLHFTSATDFCISLWSKVAPGSKSSDPPLLANKNWDSGGNIGFVLGITGGGNFEWNYREECPNVRRDFDSTVPMVDGQWHHVVFSVQRGGLARTFIDGVLRDTQFTAAENAPTTIDTDPAINDNQNCSGNGTRNAAAINIGQDGRGTYNIAITNALMDEVGIWRRALSPEEAVAIYNAGNAGQDLQRATVVASLGLLQVTYSGGNANFVWVGGAGTRLQKTTILNPSNWADVGGTIGASSHSEPAIGNAYFRLCKP